MKSFLCHGTCLAALMSWWPLAAVGAEDGLERFVYPLAAPANGPPPTFELDLSEVPDDARLAAWGKTAQQLGSDWFPIMCRFLATEDWKPPRTVRLVFKKELQAPAATSGSKIEISAKWVTEHPDDLGLVIHELTHVIQDYPPGTQPGWLTEGIADYIRYWKFEPEKPHGRIGPQSSYKEGYGTTGAFLAWANWRYDHRLVQRLDAAMRQRADVGRVFQQTTGKDVDALWKEYVDSQSR